MKKLIKGIINFRKTAIDDYRSKFAKLALRQMPDALLVACCDSRVVPNIFASSDPGDLLVMRNIGNLIPPYKGDGCEDESIAGAIEFSLINLKVSDIIVCGHSECGAMEALINKNFELNYYLSSLGKWLENAASSYIRFEEYSSTNTENLTSCNLLSRINVLQQLENLKTYPLVKERLQENQLRIHGWWFDLATADVYYYNWEYKKFILIDEKESKIILAHFEKSM